MNLIERAIQHVGSGQVGLAKAIGASPQQVQQWLYGKRPVPYEWCPRIEVATKGTVRADELRPDVEWLRDRGGAITGYRVHLAAPAGKGKKVGGDVSAIHGADATRVVTTPKSPRVKGRQGEVAHG